MHYSGFSRQVLHNYTLAGLINEAKRTASGHRLYDEVVFDRLEKIKHLQEEQYTLMQIKKILEEEQETKDNQDNRESQV